MVVDCQKGRSGPTNNDSRADCVNRWLTWMRLSWANQPASPVLSLLHCPSLFLCHSRCCHYHPGTLSKQGSQLASLAVEKDIWADWVKGMATWSWNESQEKESEVERELLAANELRDIHPSSERSLLAETSQRDCGYTVPWHQWFHFRRILTGTFDII